MSENRESSQENVPEQVIESQVIRERSSLEKEGEIRKVFNELIISREVPGKIEELVSFTPEEIDQIMRDQTLQHYSPETLQYLLKERFLENVDNFGVSLSDWKDSAVKYPQLFYGNPETIKNNIEKLSEILDLSEDQLLKAALNRPALFVQKPETVSENIEASAEILGIERNVFLKAALEQTSLLGMKPETISNTVEQSSEKLGKTREQFIKMALKAPTLFSQKPETINANVKESAQVLGITREQFLKAASSAPTLFAQKAETLNKNIEESAEIFGLEKQKFLEAALYFPNLLYSKSETLNKNIEESAQVLGIPKKQFLEAALNRPSLFSQKPETINANVEESAERLGMPKEEFLEMCLKEPTLFTLKPETNENKFKIYQRILPEDVMEDFSERPSLLTFAPERVLAHYILGKITDIDLSASRFKVNPLSFAKKKLSETDFENFKLAYEYIDNLSKKIRERGKKRGEEGKIYEDMIDFAEKFFGKRDEPLTVEKINEFKDYIEKHITPENE